MAVKIVRKRRKNADGSYDIVHYETQAKAVWMSDGRSVEEAVTAGGGSSGGGDKLVVFATATEGNSSVSNPSHTYAEIAAACTEGKTVTLVLSIGKVQYALPLSSSGISGNDFVYIFEVVAYGRELTVTVLSDGSWYFDSVFLAYVGTANYAPIYAGSDYQNPDEYLLRNSKLSSTDSTPTVNGEICWTYG